MEISFTKSFTKKELEVFDMVDVYFIHLPTQIRSEMYKFLSAKIMQNLMDSGQIIAERKTIGGKNFPLSETSYTLKVDLDLSKTYYCEECKTVLPQSDYPLIEKDLNHSNAFLCGYCENKQKWKSKTALKREFLAKCVVEVSSALKEDILFKEGKEYNYVVRKTGENLYVHVLDENSVEHVFSFSVFSQHFKMTDWKYIKKDIYKYFCEPFKD
jgi:hypothetical protein